VNVWKDEMTHALEAIESAIDVMDDVADEHRKTGDLAGVSAAHHYRDGVRAAYAVILAACHQALGREAAS
jgi:hypothetical protein